MRQLGRQCEVQPAHIDESPLSGENAQCYVQRLAQEKAKTVHTKTGGWVIGADTTVVLNGDIIGKPHDMAQAKEILASLANHSHQVMTAVALAGTNCMDCFLDVSTVYFRTLSAADIDACCQYDQPLDKAGGYALQGRSAAFIERLEGSPSGVMGLPLCKTAALLRKYNLY